MLVTRLPVKAALLARPFVVCGWDGRVLGASPEAAGARVGAPLSEGGDVEPVAALERGIFEAPAAVFPGWSRPGMGCSGCSTWTCEGWRN